MEVSIEKIVEEAINKGKCRYLTSVMEVKKFRDWACKMPAFDRCIGNAVASRDGKYGIEIIAWTRSFPPYIKLLIGPSQGLYQVICRDSNDERSLWEMIKIFASGKFEEMQKIDPYLDKVNVE